MGLGKGHNLPKIFRVLNIKLIVLRSLVIEELDRNPHQRHRKDDKL